LGSKILARPKNIEKEPNHQKNIFFKADFKLYKGLLHKNRKLDVFKFKFGGLGLQIHFSGEKLSLLGAIRKLFVVTNTTWEMLCANNYSSFLEFSPKRKGVFIGFFSIVNHDCKFSFCFTSLTKIQSVLTVKAKREFKACLVKKSLANQVGKN
jgi:hypothetical protein